MTAHRRWDIYQTGRRTIGPAPAALLDRRLHHFPPASDLLLGFLISMTTSLLAVVCDSIFDGGIQPGQTEQISSEVTPQK